MKPLTGRVAVVAGATRGAGRGIATELGAAGATVYCTGRSTRAQPSDMNRPETIEETADRASSAGGVGIAVRVDHTQEPEVQALFERVRREQGRLDILVNDVWGGDPLIQWGKPFWELEPANTRLLLERCVLSHIITSRYAVPIMLEGNSGLIIEITDGNDDGYRGNFEYDLVKNTVIRLARAMAAEFAGQTGSIDGQVASHAANITALALTPGFLRSEAMLEHFGVTEANWRDGARKDPNFIASETPHYIGRAVVALATDPNVPRFAGQALHTWGLSEIYDFTDLDGSKPHWGRHFETLKAKPEAEQSTK